jgi:hypothetical protein
MGKAGEAEVVHLEVIALGYGHISILSNVGCCNQGSPMSSDQ